MVDVTEILIHWHAGRSQCRITTSLGLDRKTVSLCRRRHDDRRGIRRRSTWTQPSGKGSSGAGRPRWRGPVVPDPFRAASRRTGIRPVPELCRILYSAMDDKRSFRVGVSFTDELSGADTARGVAYPPCHTESVGGFVSNQKVLISDLSAPPPNLGTRLLSSARRIQPTFDVRHWSPPA